MQKRITNIGKMMFGHLMLELEDGTKQLVHRGDHEVHAPAVGDMWPPDGHEHVTSGVQNGALQRKG